MPAEILALARRCENENWDAAFVGLGRRRSQTEAFGSSRQMCGVSWCRRYRVIPKSTVRIARTIQMLTRMGASLLGASASGELLSRRR
jgi:hypothetical protein